MRSSVALMLALVAVVSACSPTALGDAPAAPGPEAAGGAEADAASATSPPGSSTSALTSTTIPTTTAPPPMAPLRWLAAGDSFSSGEGLADADGGCSRSSSAYPDLARAALAETSAERGEGMTVERFTVMACTGAQTTDWPGQLDAWDAPAPNLISATFGGNDVGFVGLMADCIGLDDSMALLEDASELDLATAARLLLGRGCDRSEEAINGEIDALGADLSALYGDMAATVGDEGRVFVLGYPAPVADPAEWSTPRCEGVSGTDGRLLRRATDRLNEVIRVATEGHHNVHFVDVAPAFDGHGRCGSDPWLYGLADAVERVDDGDRERLVIRARPFHPNPAGHEAMAELLVTAISTTSTSS
ncbi:MAG: SGNH/GDSL hydrolase family protein [Actinomycetota bacterium]